MEINQPKSEAPISWKFGNVSYKFERVIEAYKRMQFYFMKDVSLQF
jgi:hypothetical protein